MIKDIKEGYSLEDRIKELKFELKKENMSTLKFKELNYYLWLKETFDNAEYEE